MSHKMMQDNNDHGSSFHVAQLADAMLSALAQKNVTIRGGAGCETVEVNNEFQERWTAFFEIELPHSPICVAFEIDGFEQRDVQAIDHLRSMYEAAMLVGKTLREAMGDAI